MITELPFKWLAPELMVQCHKQREHLLLAKQAVPDMLLQIKKVQVDDPELFEAGARKNQHTDNFFVTVVA
jgi:hypothetical protein